MSIEASYQRQNGDSQLDDEDESLMSLMMIFVVVPLLGFTILIIFIYRRVSNNRTTYHGKLILVYTPLQYYRSAP